MLSKVYDQSSVKLINIGGAKIKNGARSNFSMDHCDCFQGYTALDNYLGGDEGEKFFYPPYTPELIAIGELVNLTMFEAALALKIKADLPQNLWSYALQHVLWVRNRVPRSSIGATRFSSITGENPSFNHARVFGLTAYVLRLPLVPNIHTGEFERVCLETSEHGVYRVLIRNKDNIPNIIEFVHVTVDQYTFLGDQDLSEYMNDDYFNEKFNYESFEHTDPESEFDVGAF